MEMVYNKKSCDNCVHNTPNCNNDYCVDNNCAIDVDVGWFISYSKYLPKAVGMFTNTANSSIGRTTHYNIVGRVL